MRNRDNADRVEHCRRASNRLCQALLAFALIVPGSVFGDAPFIRGDANGDGALNIGDAITTLSYLFSGATVECLDAGDANDDGTVNIADAIHSLSYLFAIGAAPASPFPRCGQDPTIDALDCDVPLESGYCGGMPPEQLSNPGFEGTFSSVAGGWYQNTWGFSQDPVVSYGPESNPDLVHSGARCQRIVVSSLGDGGTILAQARTFTAGEIHRCSVWLRAGQPMDVAFMLQEAGALYDVPVAHIVTVGPQWTRIELTGGFGRGSLSDSTTVPGRLVIQPRQPGILWVDDASLRNFTTPVLSSPEVATTDEIPGQYFGMHVNKLGVHYTWPPVDFGLMRLWSTGTEWFRIEPWDGALWLPSSWQVGGPADRFEYYVNGYLQVFDPTVSVIYTMGMPPSWAAPDVTDAPDDPEDWRNYVQAVATRFVGKIRYWEIWNESNVAQFFSGDLPELVPLTAIATDELKTIDPQNQILSPNVTNALSLAELLQSGVGEHVDIISWHDYPTRVPEESVARILGIRSVMENYGVADLPLWITEGSVSIPNGETLTEAEKIGAASRSYLVPWCFGVRSFSWYAWDIYYGPTQTFLPLSASSSPSQYDLTTPAGDAYRETAGWLVGASMVAKNVVDDRWVIAIERPGGSPAWIVWNTSGAQSFSIPAGWEVTTVRDLGGGSQPVVGAQIPIGVMPILLE